MCHKENDRGTRTHGVSLTARACAKVLKAPPRKNLVWSVFLTSLSSSSLACWQFWVHQIARTASTHNFCTCVPFLCFYQPVLMQATFTSHHSGIRGRITITLSPCCRPQASERTFAAFLDSTPSSSKLHLTSSPAPSTHHNAGFLDFFPCYRTTTYNTNEAPIYLHSISLELPIKGNNYLDLWTGQGVA